MSGNSQPLSCYFGVLLAGGDAAILALGGGYMFDREMLVRSRSFAVLLILCAILAFAVSALTGIEWPTWC